jgi:hypothetical protein
MTTDDDTVVNLGVAPVVVPSTEPATAETLGTAFCIASFVSGKAVFVTSRAIIEDCNREHGRYPTLLLRTDRDDATAFVEVPIESVSSGDASGVVLVRINALKVNGATTVPCPRRDLSLLRARTGESVEVLGYGVDDVVKQLHSWPVLSQRFSTVVNDDAGSDASECFEVATSFEDTLRGAPVTRRSGAVIGVVIAPASDAPDAACLAQSVTSLMDLTMGLETDYGGERKYSLAKMIHGTYVHVREE